MPPLGLEFPFWINTDMNIGFLFEFFLQILFLQTKFAGMWWNGEQVFAASTLWLPVFVVFHWKIFQPWESGQFHEQQQTECGQDGAKRRQPRNQQCWRPPRGWGGIWGHGKLGHNGLKSTNRKRMNGTLCLCILIVKMQFKALTVKKLYCGIPQKFRAAAASYEIHTMNCLTYCEDSFIRWQCWINSTFLLQLTKQKRLVLIKA